MKKIILPPRLKSFLGALVLSIGLFSCNADKEAEEVQLVAGPLETEFSLVDSITINPFFKNSHAELYARLNGKTYSLQSKDKVETFFLEEDNQVVLYFREITSQEERPWVSFTFKNRTVAQMASSISAKDKTLVCVEGGQNFADGSGALSPGCIDVKDGAITLQYDKATDVLSGSITQLKLPLEYYVPEYAFPNTAGNIIKSGSSRNINITFRNVKRLKRS